MRLARSFVLWNKHGFAMPLVYPARFSVALYSSHQFWAASRVPYIESRNLPHTSGSPDLVPSSGSLMYVGQIDLAQKHSLDESTHTKPCQA